MVEAIDIFHEHLHSPWFQKSAIILFLNKEDLFEAKIQERDIKSVEQWADFDGPSWTDSARDEAALAECKLAGVEYFLDKFVSLPPAKQNGKPKKHVFPHVTTATNRENVKTVFNACREFILRCSMAESGFLS